MKKHHASVATWSFPVYEEKHLADAPNNFTVPAEL